jgi:hypothetical protein
MYRFGFFEFYSPIFVQMATLFIADCSFLVVFQTVSPTVMTAVSSANVAMVLFDVVGTSLIYSRYKTGPSTLPCGTPALISFSSE